MNFARSRADEIPQFIPGEDHKLLDVGSADAQVAEAMRLAKERNTRPEVGLAERIAKLDAMTTHTATDFLDGLSQLERERWLIAERMGKARVTVLGRYGW